MAQPERDEVESALVRQLEAMGWTHLPLARPGEYTEGSKESGRHSYADVVLIDRFRAALRRINLDPDGQPWLDEDRLTSIVNSTIHDPEQGLPGNITFTELLTGSELTVEGMPDWDDGVRQPVTLVDWRRPEDNDLLVVSQFRVDTPDGSKPYRVPDLVLFVNGLPLVVIECKRPGPTGIDDAITDLIDYAGVGQAEVPDFTRFTQILVATDRESVRYGTVTSRHEHFNPWWWAERETVEPQVRSELDKPDHHPLLGQEIFAGETLRPSTLLGIVRDFIVNHAIEGRTVKIVARPHQYRAVRKMSRRLVQRRRGLREDYRGGVTWHTQGSGKSLTMTFLVRVLRSDDELRGFKVVVVTDRLDLEEQIQRTLGSSGQTPRRANSVDDAHDHLSRSTPDLVLVTIQKSRRDDESDDEQEQLGEDLETSRLDTREANDSSEIVVLVDEAHRSQESWLHARLRKKVPNATMFGFTGTPILHTRKKKTEDIFGQILDVYTLHDAERDGAVVPLRYESVEAQAEVVNRAVLDSSFAREIPDGPERAVAIDRFARRREVLESADLIRVKAEQIFRLWLLSALPDRFSAQVVAVSRRAAVRYQQALTEVRDRLIEEADNLSVDIPYDPTAIDEHTQFLLVVRQHRALLSQIAAVAVISENRSLDDHDWRIWTDKHRQKEYITRFKQGLGEPDPAPLDPEWAGQEDELPHRHPIHEGSDDPWDQNLETHERVRRDRSSHGIPSDPIAFIVVQKMLLTGFDAPVEQILCIDRPMRSVELLQAIARPNRPRKHKEFGRIVDFAAVSGELAQALADYDPAHLTDVIGDARPNSIMAPLDQTVVPELRAQYQRVASLLAELGVESLRTPAEREELLAHLDDPELRARFDDVTRSFLSALNAVLPRPEALEYESIARHLGIVQYLARYRYRDKRHEFSPYRCGAKVRQLIDTHIRAEGIVQRIPPVAITASDFAEKVEAQPDDRARALEMKHALREHIDTRIASDPITYQRLSQRLEQILRELEEDHDYGRLVMDLFGLHADTVAAEQEADRQGLDRWTERPIHSLIERALEELTDDVKLDLDLIGIARDLAQRVRVEVQAPHFQYNRQRQETVRKRFVRELVIELHFPIDLARRNASELCALAINNRESFLRLRTDVS